jgi:NAD(P)-dependent dehydrogenase (short-subunit alcohol dehydrogenase family)
MPPDRFSLEGKVALITGGTRGIGKAIASTFARQGAKVVVAGRKAEGVSAAVAELKAAGGEASGIPANVSKADDVSAMVEHAVATYGAIDILVNNAAVNPVFGPVVNTSTEAFDKIIAVNVRAPFELAKLVLPQFQLRGAGAILNIASIGGLSPEHGLGIYSVSKAAIISLTQVLAREWGKENVRANAICPGLIRTDFSGALWKDERILEHMMRSQAIARLGQPDDVAGLALLLCSDAGAFCTGGVYLADGGYLV